MRLTALLTLKPSAHLVVDQELFLGSLLNTLTNGGAKLDCFIDQSQSSVLDQSFRVRTRVGGKL